MENIKCQEVEILLVEDNPGDIRLMQEALKEAKVSNSVIIARDGQEAVDYLFEHRDENVPDLILLDINLPKLSGFEVLKQIKADEKLKIIPVVIVTSSSSEDDVLQSYRHYANCFVTKPLDMDQFVKVVSAVDNFWLTIAKLPPEQRR